MNEALLVADSEKEENGPWGGAFPGALRGAGFRGGGWGWGEKRAGPMSRKGKGDLGRGEHSVARPEVGFLHSVGPLPPPFGEVFWGKACSHKSKPMTQAKPTIESPTPPTERPLGMGKEPNYQTRDFF